MAVTLAGTAYRALGSDGTTLSVFIPAGGTRDVVVVIVRASGDFGEASIDVPLGWAPLGTQQDLSGGDEAQCARAFYKPFLSSASSSVAVDVSGFIEPASGDMLEALALRYSGVDTANPIPEVGTVTLNLAVGTSTPHTSITIGAGNWSVIADFSASIVTRTPPVGWTEDFEVGRFWAGHREYASATATGPASTAHTNTANRIGWAWEIAAEAVQTIATNAIASGANVRSHAVTPRPRTVVAQHIASTNVRTPGVQPGATTVVANHRASTAALHQPAVTNTVHSIGMVPLASGTFYEPVVAGGQVSVVANHLGPTSVLPSHGVFLGDAIPVSHIGPVALVLDPAVSAGPVAIAPSLIGPTLPVLYEDGTPVLWEDGSSVLWEVPAGVGSATLFAPGPVHAAGLEFAHLGPTAQLYAPTTYTSIPHDHLGPTSRVYAQLLGSFVVLAEPDETVWGASGGFSARVDFLDAAGSVIASTDDPDSRIVLVSGNVNEDRTQAVTRECSVRLLLASETSGELHPLNPSRPGDPLDPRTGGALAIYAGPIRPSGAPDYTKLGVFKITEANAVSSDTGESLELRGLSQEHEIRAAGFWVPTVVLKNTSAVAAMVALVVEAVPDIDFTTETSNVKVPGELSWGDGDDRLSAVNDLAASVAMEARFDRDGVYRVRKAAQFGDEDDQSPRWTFAEGALATVRDVSRSISDAELFNGVIVVGEPLTDDDDPVRAEVWDTRPSSPVYYDPDNPGRSLTGPRPKKIVTPLVTTVAQANAMAAAELAKVLAFADKVSVTTAANPEIEAEDVVRVVRATMGVDALYRVTSVTHDLLGGSSQAVCVAL